MIPGAFEPNVRPTRDTRAATLVQAIPSREARPQPVTDSASYVVAAPAQPTTLFGQFAAVLGDVGLGAALVLAVALVPVLAFQAIVAAAAFTLKTLGWQ